MIPAGLPGGLATTLLALLLVSSARADDGGGLKPFQIVRSLELVQDRIAGGDHAALPMQRKLLEMADSRFRAIDQTELIEPLNLRALLIYAMNGGNPATVAVALARLGADDPVRGLGEGILSYLQGQPKTAQEKLAAIDPMAETPELGSYLALIKGSMLATDQPQAAVQLLDQARLLAPGTLVEEAALRRSIAVATQLGDASRFTRASGQYVRFYLRSPYAAQFADAFVAGVIVLHGNIHLEAIGEIADAMDAERRKVIYLRITREAAIDGLTELSAFAAARAEGKDDPRTLLYSSLSSVTSETVEDVLAKLATIDRSRLSESDRQLLDAASAMAAEMTAAPVETTPAMDRPAGGEPDSRGDGLPEPAVPQAGATPVPPSTTAEQSAPSPADEAEAVLAGARKKLAEIDSLLGEDSR